MVKLKAKSESFIIQLSSSDCFILFLMRSGSETVRYFIFWQDPDQKQTVTLNVWTGNTPEEQC